MTTSAIEAARRTAPLLGQAIAKRGFSRWPALARLAAIYEQAACLVIGAIFLASGILHLENPYYFLSSVYSYKITGPVLGEIVAMILPAGQVAIAACLLGRVCVGGALITSGALSSIFAAAQGTGMWRELNIDCGCFGSGYIQTIGTASVLMAVGLLLLAISAYAARGAATVVDA